MNQQEETVPALWIVNGKSFDIRQRSEAEKLMQLATLGARVLEILRNRQRALDLAQEITDRVEYHKAVHEGQTVAVCRGAIHAAGSIGLLGEEAP